VPDLAETAYDVSFEGYDSSEYNEKHSRREHLEHRRRLRADRAEPEIQANAEQEK
jgi:hypothetical protein